MSEAVAPLEPESAGASQEMPRTARGQFPRGVSGNPKGRKPGTKNRATALVEALVCGRAEEVGKALVERAIGGDPVAMRLVVERLWPPPREPSIRTSLPTLKDANDAPSFIAQVIAGVGAGELTVGEAAQIAELVSGFLKAAEAVELSKRIAAIEARLGEDGGGSNANSF